MNEQKSEAELQIREEVADQLVDHIRLVEFYIRQLTGEATRRAERHDESKWSKEEWDLFLKYTPKLKNCTYGSPEYLKYLKELKPALDHHYQCNRHHPEHHMHEGIGDMNLVDILEMLCDWLASTKRHADGDIFKSIEINQKRFGYSDDLKNILKNTACWLTYKNVVKELKEKKNEGTEKSN